MLLVARLIVLVREFARFVVEGFGTLALVRRFGADYEAYRRAVPAWWPRLRPWKPSEREEGGAR